MNPHSLFNQQPLKLSRLPIPPSQQRKEAISNIPKIEQNDKRLVADVFSFIYCLFTD